MSELPPRSGESTQDVDESMLPWYRQFWAWFILFPLIAVVISCSITVTIAVMNADDRVVDKYYKEGRLINVRLDEDILAAELDLVADVTFDQDLQEMVVRLQSNTGEYPDTLVLELSHISNQNYDHQVRLQHIAKGQYQAELEQLLRYRWYLRLRPLLDPTAAPEDINALATAGTQWRLRGNIDFSSQSVVRLAATL